MHAKRLPDSPLDPVAIDCALSEPFCDDHPEPGAVSWIIAHQGPERTLANSQLRVLEHLVELGPATQAAVAGKTHGNRPVLAELCRQALAPFGTPRVDHLAAATSRHASPEAVIALPLDDAWLKGPLHVGPTGKRSAILWAVPLGVNFT